MGDGQHSQGEESSGCAFPVTLFTDIGGEVFLGNIALFTCILVGIFVVHILVASGIEACWVSKVQRAEFVAEPTGVIRVVLIVRRLNASISGFLHKQTFAQDLMRYS